jgi:N-acetylglutamate synthase-like GNAT family acetyltransferase
MSSIAVDVLRTRHPLSLSSATLTTPLEIAGAKVRKPNLFELSSILDACEQNPETEIGNSIKTIQELVRATKNQEQSPLILRTAEYQGSRAHIIASQQGMRGMIHHLFFESAGNEHQAILGNRLVNQVIAEFQERSIFRAHVLVSKEHAHNHPLSIHGFKEVQGERLQEFQMKERPIQPEQLHQKGFQIEEVLWQDQQELFERFSEVPELAIAPWEQDAAHRILHSNSNGYICFAVREQSSGRLVGAYFGGYAGSRGTCNHIVIEPEYRHHKLASDLVAHALPKLYDHGVRTVHIMTTAGNDPAFKFWEKQGFIQSSKGTFLEADISY